MDPINAQQPPQQPVAPLSAAPQTTPVQPKSSLPKMLIILLGIVVLAGLIGGAYVLGAKSSKPIEQKKAVTISPAEPSQTPTPSPQQLQTFSDTAQNISFQYPAGWQVVTDAKIIYNAVVVPDKLAPALKADIKAGGDGACHPFYPIIFSDITSETNITLPPKAEDYQKVTQSQITVSGQPATLYTVDMNFKPCDYQTGKYEVIWLSYKGKTYTMTLIPSDNPEYKKAFDQFVASFKFTQ